jgi:HEAT repeat protein
MIQFACSNCDTELEVAEQKAGAKVACPECATKLTVPEPRPAGKTASGRSPTVKTGSGRVPAVAGGSGKRPAVRRDDAPAKKSGGSGLLIGGIVGGVLLVGLVVGIAVMVMNKPEEDFAVNSAPSSGSRPASSQPAPSGKPTQPAPSQPQQPTPQEPAPSTPAPGGNAAPVEGSAAKLESTSSAPIAPMAVLGGGASGEEIYKYVLKSAVLIVVVGGAGEGGGGGVSIGMGSGSLVDFKNRIIVTNYHVVRDNPEVAIFFPIYRDGKLVKEKQTYLDLAVKGDKITGLRGKVLERDRTKDLAIVQLDRLPDNVEALRLSDGPPNTGANIWSLGNPGASQLVFGVVPGNVRNVGSREWTSSGSSGEQPLTLKAEVVETNSACGPGDSGGPLVNERGEQVGVTQGGQQLGNMALFISVNELAGFLRGYYRRSSWAWPPESSRGLLVAHGAGSAAEAAVPSLMRQLRDTNPEVRTRAAVTLGQLGAEGSPATKQAIPFLLDLVRTDTDDLARRNGITALNKIGAPNKEDVQVLVDNIKDKSPDVRRYCAMALGLLGFDGRSGMRALVDAAKAKEPPVRQSVALALGRMGSDAKDTTFPVLLELLKDDDRDVRQAAVDGLNLVGGLTSADLPQLVDLLQVTNAEAKVYGATALGKLGPAAKPALASLQTVFREKEPLARQAAVEALVAIGLDSKSAVPLCIEALQEKDRSLRRRACQALARIGPDAEPASPQLKEAARDIDKDLRKLAILAFGKIGVKGKFTVAEVATALEDNDSEVKAAACTAFADLGPTLGPADKKKVLPKVILLLAGPNDEIRAEAAKALGKFGSMAAPQLGQALNHQDERVRLAAATALSDLGKDAKAAYSSLIAHAQADTNELVKLKCAEAVKKVQAGK